MLTEDRTGASTAQRPWASFCSRWSVPIICLLAAGGYLGVFAARGKVWDGLATSGIMLGYGTVLLLFRRRSEIAAVLSGHRTDERRQQINLRACTFSMNVIAVVALAAAFADLARGRDTGAWGVICVVGGGSYLAGVAIYSVRA